MSCFEALTALRQDPTDERRLAEFLRPVDKQFARWSAKLPHDPGRRQRALLKVYRGWTRCRAESERRLAAWLRTVWRRAHPPRSAVRTVPLETVRDPVDPGDPEAVLVRKGVSHAISTLVREASRVALDDLPRNLRNRARKQRVATTQEGRIRDVALLIALRRDSCTSRELAERHSLSADAVKQAARRGAAWLSILANHLQVHTRDMWLRQGLELVAGTRPLPTTSNLPFGQ